MIMVCFRQYVINEAGPAPKPRKTVIAIAINFLVIGLSADRPPISSKINLFQDNSFL